MGSNSFGNVFTITTWGESHGPAIGVVIDGCPAGVCIDATLIQQALEPRQGGTPWTTPRKEPDSVQILSGVFEGKTTGTPISLLIENKDVDSSKYEPIQHLLRPGHANFTYLEKYGCFDYRGGGRASGRETACRVMAGAVAKAFIGPEIVITAFLRTVGAISAQDPLDLSELKAAHPLPCPDRQARTTMALALDTAMTEGDSLGSIVECVVTGLPTGLGEPIYDKLEANLAKAMLSIPATKGFEIGRGFAAAQMQGSTHNDPFTLAEEGCIATSTNHAGGTLAGISTGAPLVFRVPFKPTASIRKPQATMTCDKQPATLSLPEGSRHDPCIGIRAVPVVEAMTALVIADHILMHRLARV